MMAPDSFNLVKMIEQSMFSVSGHLSFLPQTEEHGTMTVEGLPSRAVAKHGTSAIQASVWQSTAQHSTAQHSTAQHSTAQHSTDNTVLLVQSSEDCCLLRAVAKHGTSAIQALLGRASNPLIRKPVSLRLLRRYFRIREAFSCSFFRF